MGSNKYKNNSRKDAYFDENFGFPSMDDMDCTLTKRCKFNFSYFTNDANAGQDFNEWDHNQLVKLLNKLKDYSKENLEYWLYQKSGKYPTLAIYDNFPDKTDFTRPKSIPHQALWARFHLENLARLIGFVIPAEKHGKFHEKTGISFDKNTFYVVFLDKDHKFYITEKS